MRKRAFGRQRLRDFPNLLFGPSRPHHQIRERAALSLGANHGLERRRARAKIAIQAALLQFEKRCRLRAAQPQPRDMQHRATANGNHRRELPQDEAVSRQRERRVGQAQVRQSRASRRHFRHAEQLNFRDGLRRTVMEMHARAIFQLSRRTQQSDARTQPRGRLEPAGGGDNHTPGHLLMVNPGQIERRALPRRCARHRFAAGLYGANAQAPGRRKQIHLVFRLHLALRALFQ